jgi:putative endonuclease
MARREYYVYILANESRMVYIGVTNSMERRMQEHKAKLVDGFAKRYNMTLLVYYEGYDYIEDAIAREKQLKGWLRRRKLELIEEDNPEWEDLSADWDIAPDE